MYMHNMCSSNVLMISACICCLVLTKCQVMNKRSRWKWKGCVNHPLDLLRAGVADLRVTATSTAHIVHTIRSLPKGSKARIRDGRMQNTPPTRNRTCRSLWWVLSPWPPWEVLRGQRPSSVPPGLPLNPNFTRSAVLKQKTLHRHIHSCIYLWANPMSAVYMTARHTANNISADLAHCTL